MSFRRKVNPVSQTANPVDVGSRTAWWLRSSGYSAKQVARVIGASEGTGKRLRAGIPPTTEQLAKLANHFGWRFLAFAFEAVIGPDPDALAADLEEIKERLARLEHDDELDREDGPAPAPGARKVAHSPCRVVEGIPASGSARG